MRNLVTFALAVFALPAGPLAEAAEEQGIRLAVLGSMERIRQDQEPPGRHRYWHWPP